VKDEGRKFAAPWTIRVQIGSPMRFSQGTDPQEIAERLHTAVARLGITEDKESTKD
jgi:hypothetical protein